MGRDGQLEDHGERRGVGQAALGSRRSASDSGEDALHRVRCLQMRPMLGGEIVEGQERFPILRQAIDGLVMLGSTLGLELIQRRFGVGAAFGHPNLLEVVLGGRLEGFGHLVQYVGRLVDPAPLVARGRVDLLKGLPEADRTVPRGQIRRHPEAPGLEIGEQFDPALLALAQASLEADQLLPTLRRGTDENEDALLGVLHPGLEIHAVGPDIHVGPGRQIAAPPAVMLVRPFGLEAAHRLGGERGRVRSQQSGQGLLEVATGDAAQVKGWQHGVHRPRPPREPGQ